jgi:23S rRNA (uridine2552-2'-O)-methyltransferase
MVKAYQVQDKYFLKAKQEGYRARSAFKLLDIDQKFRIIHPGQKVLDLGSAPGSFLQVLAKGVGPKGFVYGLDLQKIAPFSQPNIKTAVCDILDEEAVATLFTEWNLGALDLITSDLAPNTSGIRDVDQARSAELVEMAWKFSEKHLRKGGDFIAKVFQGEDLNQLLPMFKSNFRKVSFMKPPSCRDRSFETFIICLGYKGPKSK